MIETDPAHKTTDRPILRGFPYIVVYRANAIPPRILRVLHGARDLPEVLQDLEREGGV